MNDTAQDYKKLLSDAIQKQIIILGKEITLIKVRNIPGLNVNNEGSITAISGNQRTIATQFLEQFRDLSSPLVRQTMQPLLSAIGPILPQQSQPLTKNENPGTTNKIS